MFLCAYRSRINRNLKWVSRRTSTSCPQTPAWKSIILRQRRQVFKNLNRHGNKTSRGALGCAKGVGFRIMARERMAKLLKYCHFEAISCHIMTYFMKCQKSMLIREVWDMATSYPWPSDDDLTYTMASAASNYTGKKLSEPNWMLESGERSQNDTKSYKFVL